MYTYTYTFRCQCMFIYKQRPWLRMQHCILNVHIRWYVLAHAISIEKRGNKIRVEPLRCTQRASLSFDTTTCMHVNPLHTWLWFDTTTCIHEWVCRQRIYQSMIRPQQAHSGWFCTPSIGFFSSWAAAVHISIRAWRKSKCIVFDDLCRYGAFSGARRTWLERTCCKQPLLMCFAASSHYRHALR